METIVVGTPAPQPEGEARRRVVVIEDVPDATEQPEQTPGPVDAPASPPPENLPQPELADRGEPSAPSAPPAPPAPSPPSAPPAPPFSFDLIANPAKVREYVPEGEEEHVAVEPSNVVRHVPAPPVPEPRMPPEEALPEWTPRREEHEYDRRWDGSSDDPYEEARKMRALKNDLLCKLDVLERQGYRLPKKFNHNSDLDEMQSVHKRITTVAKADAGLKISRKLLIGFTGLIEWANNAYDPVGAHLDGWSNHVMAHIHDFDSALTRIWERYADVLGETNPIIELVLALTMSGVMFHFTQKMLATERRDADTRLNDPRFRAAMAGMRPGGMPVPPPSPPRRAPSPPPPPPSSPQDETDPTMDRYRDMLSSMPTMVPPTEEIQAETDIDDDDEGQPRSRRKRRERRTVEI